MTKDNRFKPGNKLSPGSKKGVAKPGPMERIRKLAQKHGPAAIRLLVADMKDPKLDRDDRRAAAIALLDRGYGKATQPVGGDPTAPFHVIIKGDDAKL